MSPRIVHVSVSNERFTASRTIDMKHFSGQPSPGDYLCDVVDELSLHVTILEQNGPLQPLYGTTTPNPSRSPENPALPEQNPAGSMDPGVQGRMP